MSYLFFCKQEEMELVRHSVWTFAASKFVCSPLKQGKWLFWPVQSLFLSPQNETLLSKGQSTLVQNWIRINVRSVKAHYNARRLHPDYTKNNEKRLALSHNVMQNLTWASRASVYFFAVAMKPELRLLASSVLWTIYILSWRKAECRSFICRVTTLKLQ